MDRLFGQPRLYFCLAIALLIFYIVFLFQNELKNPENGRHLNRYRGKGRQKNDEGERPIDSSISSVVERPSKPKPPPLARCTPSKRPDIKKVQRASNDSFDGITDPKVLVEIFRSFKLDTKLNGSPLKLREPEKDPWLQSNQRQAGVVDKLLKEKTKGFFIEAGALDGEFYSNTLALEVVRNWTGLLVEPDPNPYRALMHANRNAFTTSSCLAVSDSLEMRKFLSSQVMGWSALAGMTKHQDIQLNQEVTVSCFPLSVMLDAINQTRVDYFSLDIEGPELEILQSIPFDRIHFSVFTIETTGTSRQAVVDYMATQCFDVVAAGLTEDLVLMNRNDRIDLGYDPDWPF